MNPIQNKLFSITAVTLILSACATNSGRLSESHDDASSNLSKGTNLSISSDQRQVQQYGVTRSKILMKSGAEFLVAGELEKAQQVFNTALKFDAKSAPLHFLNALTYHMSYLKGDADSLALAESGYRAALMNDPSMEMAYLQLGRLFIVAKDYTRGKQAMALAVDSDDHSMDALYGLAQAAFFDGDLATSFWAVSELERLHWHSPQLYRLKAMQAAIAQQPERARSLAGDYATASSDQADVKYLFGRVDRLLSSKVAFRPDPQSVLLAQLAPDTEAKKIASNPKETETSSKSKAWFSCDPNPGIPMPLPAAQPITPITLTDESMFAPTLPAPCVGVRPQMAMFEVTMIKTMESSNKAFGINLLDGLSAVLTSKSTSTFTNSTGVAETVRSRSSELINSAAGQATSALRYSLNIANAAFTKNQVISHPTIAAVDRVPAIFFSGANITLGVAGTGTGTSTTVEKPIGVSLSITPTFVDSNTVLVSMRATRSFIDANSANHPSVLLQQTRNSISASAMLNFGETYVLSGLVEKSADFGASGTPVLQDIPVLQYLFKHSAKAEFSRQILTLITVRKLVDASPDEERKQLKAGDISTHQMSQKVADFFRLGADKTAIDEVLAGIRGVDQSYRKYLRGRDFHMEDSGEESRLKSILDSLKEAAYF